MADLIPSIYHETQQAGSMLCAQHALNNLLQSSTFTAQDLADIARQLDQLEQDQLDLPLAEAGESHNYDDSGFFSIMVIEEAVKLFGFNLVRWNSKELDHMRDKPERMEAFILNHQLHWYTIRKFSKDERWYNLDSCQPAPTWISPMYLGLTLREAELQGYSILALVPSPASQISTLPTCPASDLAISLPRPNASTSSYKNSTTGASTSADLWKGVGNTLSSISGSGPASGSGSGSGAGTSLGRAKRPPSPGLYEAVAHSPEGYSSVEEESEKRRKKARPRPNGIAGTEEDEMAWAIAESLRSSTLDDEKGKGKKKKGEAEVLVLDDDDGVDELEDDVEEVLVVDPTDRKGKDRKTDPAPQPQSQVRSRGYADEEDELERAIRESLLVSGVKEVEEQPEEEDDSPSVEELRRRRLARFGA
ncbi:Josephin-domain-containing protein [Meredithblackwellia eburnea MCA 4105]